MSAYPNSPATGKEGEPLRRRQTSSRGKALVFLSRVGQGHADYPLKNPSDYWTGLTSDITSSWHGSGGKWDGSETTLSDHTKLLRDFARRDATRMGAFLITGRQALLAALEKEGDPSRIEIFKGLLAQLEGIQLKNLGLTEKCGDLEDVDELEVARTYSYNQDLDHPERYVEGLMNRYIA